MLELALIPILVGGGLTLLMLGVHGAPKAPALAPVLATKMTRAARALSGEAGQIRWRLEDWRRGQDESPGDSLRKATIFGDVLLADLLTEMLMVREELAALRSELESYKARSAKRPRSSAALSDLRDRPA